MKKELMSSLVRLRPLRKADLRRRAEWTDDDELVSSMGADPTEEPFVSPQDEEQRNVDWLEDRENAGDQLYAIEVNGRYVGDIDIEFFPETRRAQITLFVGDRSASGKGYGIESARLVLQELVAEPEVDRVEVDVPKGNDRSLRFWQKLSFCQFKTDDDGTRWLSRSVEDKPVP